MAKKIEQENLNLRSEEVQEILSNPPIWIVRWGITLIFMFTCIILTLSFLIKYPDVVTAKVIVTTKSPTEQVVSRYSGQLHKLFVENRDTVEVNQKLAVLRNTANYEDYYKLKSIVDTLSMENLENFMFPIEQTRYLSLGDIESAYINFEKSYSDYFLLRDLDPYTSKLKGGEITLREIKTRLRNQIIQKGFLEQEFQLKEGQFARQKHLFEKGIISKQDYENKKLEFLQMQKNISNMAISISQMREAIASANQDLTRTQIDEKEQNLKFFRNMMQSYNLLTLRKK